MNKLELFRQLGEDLVDYYKSSSSQTIVTFISSSSPLVFGRRTNWVFTPSSFLKSDHKVSTPQPTIMFDRSCFYYSKLLFSILFCKFKRTSKHLFDIICKICKDLKFYLKGDLNATPTSYVLVVYILKINRVIRKSKVMSPNSCPHIELGLVVIKIRIWVIPHTSKSLKRVCRLGMNLGS